MTGYSLWNWFRARTRRHSRARAHVPGRPLSRFFRPDVELLEKRQLLSTVLRPLNPDPLTEGQDSGPVALATFIPGDGNLGDYQATITWGDGASFAAVIQPDGGAGRITGDHTYKEEGGFTVGLSLTGPDGTVTANAGLLVLGAPLAGTAAAVSTTEGSAFTGVVATFTDADPGSTAADFTATIDWGDGQTSGGFVEDNGHGGFNVQGGNLYLEGGTYPVQVVVRDDGHSTVVLKGTATVADAALKVYTCPTEGNRCHFFAENEWGKSLLPTRGSTRRMGGPMSEHVPLPDPAAQAEDRRPAAAPDGPVPGRLGLSRETAPPALHEPAAAPGAPAQPPARDASTAAADGRQELPRLQTPRRGRRLVQKPATPAAPLTPQQRLLLLDTWQRSGLPAGDFAALVGLSKHTLYAWKKKFDAQGPAGLMGQPRGGPAGSKLPDLTKRAILLLKQANRTRPADYVENGRSAEYLDGADQLTARVSAAGAASWYLADRQRSVIGLTGATGALQDQVQYDAFGNVTAQSNPAAGRWTTQDTLGLSGGDTNLHRYINAHSRRNAVPMGRKWQVMARGRHRCLEKPGRNSLPGSWVGWGLGREAALVRLFAPALPARAVIR